MRVISAFLLVAITSSMAFSFVGPTKVLVTPPAPKFTDAERHAELAKRRAAVAAKMADNSVMILMSAEPKLYTNDVD